MAKTKTRTMLGIAGLLVASGIAAWMFRGEAIEVEAPSWSAPRPTNASLDAPTVEVRERDDPIAPHAERTSVPDGIVRFVLRSDAGFARDDLRLRVLDVSGAEQPFTPARDDASAVLVGGVADPLTFEAPGHLPTTVPRDAGEVVLIGDDVLRLEGVSIGEAIQGLDWANPQFSLDPSLVERYVCAAAIGDDAWSLACSSAALRSEFVDPISLTIRMRGGAQLHLTRRLIRGARDSVRIDPEWLLDVPRQDLRIELVGRRPGESVSLRLSETPRHDAPSSRIEDVWGLLVFVRREPFQEREVSIDAVESAISIRAVALGREYALVATSDHGAYGRTIFEHDGAPQRIELLPGTTIRGRIESTSGEPPSRILVTWSFREIEAATNHYWRKDRVPVEVTPAGRFEFAPVIKPVPSPTVAMPCPSQVHLTIRALRHRTAEISQPAEFGAVTDVGTVVLHAMQPDLVIRAGHGFSRGVSRLVVKVRDAEGAALLEARQVLRRSDGGLDVFFVAGDGEHVRESGEPLTSDAIAALLATATSAAIPAPEGGLLGLARESDGTWSALPSRIATITIVGTGDEDYRLYEHSVAWRGLEFGGALLPIAANGAVELRLHAPLDGAQFLLRHRTDPQVVHSVPIAAAEVHVTWR